MSNYDLLKQRIQEAIPTLMDWSIGNIIKQIEGENSGDIYTIGYDCWLTSNGKYIELDDSLEYNLSDFILIGKEPMLNDVLEWLKSISEYTDKYCITIGGDFLKMNFIQSSFELINSHTNPRWDMSKPYLKDQSTELIEWLSTLELIEWLSTLD